MLTTPIIARGPADPCSYPSDAGVRRGCSRGPRRHTRRAVPAAGAAAIRRIRMVAATCFAARRSVLGRDEVAQDERLADADRDLRPGAGAAGPWATRGAIPAIPIGTTGAPVRSARTAIPSLASWSAPVGLRVPSGKTHRTPPSSRMRIAGRNASTSASPRSTRVDPAVGRQPADDRPVEHLLLAHPVDPPTHRRDEPRADERTGSSVGGVVRGDDERAASTGRRRALL